MTKNINVTIRVQMSERLREQLLEAIDRGLGAEIVITAENALSVTIERDRMDLASAREEPRWRETTTIRPLT